MPGPTTIGNIQPRGPKVQLEGALPEEPGENCPCGA